MKDPQSIPSAANSRVDRGDLSRSIAAWVLLLAPLGALPLSWVRIFGGSVPWRGDVRCFDLPELGMLAAAAALLFPERIISGIRNLRLFRLLAAFTVTALVVAVIHQLVSGGSREFFTLSFFFLLTPWAGFALAPELRRALPRYAAGLFVLLALYTIGDRFFSGFPGNWNWNLTLLTVTFPALLLRLPGTPLRKLGTAVVSALLLLLILSWFRPELLPRGTLLGAAIALPVTWAAHHLRRKRRFFAGMAALLIGGAIFAMMLQWPLSAPDSRRELWRGAVRLVENNPLAGVGPGRFQGTIKEYLPLDYYFSAHPATLHPHPHNEVLNYAAGFGISGVCFFALLVLTAWRRSGADTPEKLWMFWAFLTLLAHGQVDVLLATPLAGMLFMLLPGAINGGGPLASPIRFPRLRPIVATVLAAAALWGASVNWRSGREFRAAKLLAGAPARRGALQRAVAIKTEARSLYTLAAVELFDFRNPAAALELLDRLDRLNGHRAYLHSFQLRGRALAAGGDLEGALHSFRREAREFPLSAINSGLLLQVLEYLPGSSPEELSAAREHFVRMMKLRGIAPENFPLLLRNPAWDDEPLPPPSPHRNESLHHSMKI